jgi:hypothetical protein
MAVTAVTTYYVDVGSIHLENTSGVFYGTPYVISGGTLHADTTIYKVGDWIIGFGERVPFGGYGPSRVLPGTVLGNYTWFDAWGHNIGGSSITATGGSFVTNEGQRIITLKAVGGSVASPSLAGGGEIVPTGWAFPVGDISAHTSFATITAGNGLPNTGTLTTRGYAEGVWNRWSWTSGVITSGSDPTEKTIVVSLLAGYDDGVVKANFTRPQNSASVWSPKEGNIVIHVLDGNLSETHLSTSYTASDTKWSEFLTIAKFTALSCSAGGKTRHWRSTSQYDDKAYLLNVDAATFSVSPETGMRVYGWKLEPAPIDGVAQAMVDFGSNTSALISGFEEGCKVHLYLTSASPNPRVVYDGFDDTGDVPTNEAVVATGTGFTAISATQWVSNSAAPVEITLAPVAWAARGLGQLRSVIKDDGAPVPLANVDGTSASIVSSTAQYSVTHVKFKQTQLDTDGLLTITIVEDTITPVDGISVRVSQENTPLGTLTASGTVGYYVGSGNLVVMVDVDYGSQSKSDFVVTVEIPASESYDGDVNSAGDVQLSAAVAARSITVNVLQKINYGTITSASMNISRTVGAGEPIPNAISTDSLIVQCYAGSFSVTRNASTEINEPITVECYAKPGYRVKTLLVYSDDEDVSPQQTYRSLPAKEGVWQIESLAIPRIYDGTDIKFVLVMEADIVGTPLMLPMAPDDLGKFSASVVSDGGYGDFRVGDSVTLTVDVVEVNSTPLTGAAIGSPTFNDVPVIPVRNGTSVEATVTLGPGTNVFKIPVYAVLETATAPADAGTIDLTVAWDVEDTLFIDPVTYRRIGSAFTVTAPLASTNPATYTLIAGRVSLREIASGFGYHVVEVLLPVVAGATTRTFTSTLRGPSEFTAVYAIGVQYPAFVVAAYDYGAGAYITQGVRPVVATTPVSPAALSDNLIADLVTDWPESGTPGTDYRDAAFLYREVTTTDLLPGIDIRITSAVGARLEMWNSATSLWVPYSPTGITLADAFTYFRVSIGDAPENLVSVAFETAVRVDADGDETEVPGCKVYATSGAVYDGNFILPSTIQVRSRSVLHARATPPYGYVVTGWYIDGVLSPHGASLSVVVPDIGLTLKPQVEIRQVAPLNVMVLNADPNLTDEGLWVSKLFRAQYPWKPLTANVVVRPSDAPVTLGVLKDGGDAPEELDTESPGTVAVTVTGDGMRRLPPGQIQKTRFVRYMVLVSGVASVASVAIGSGAETMKGGH